MLKLDEKSYAPKKIRIEGILSEIKADWETSFRFTANTIVIHNGTPDPSQNIQNIFKDIAKRLNTKRRYLDHLYITSYNSNNSVDHLKTLFSSIAIHLPNIRGLTMNFASCLGLSNSREFSYNLCKTLGHLERLELNFNFNQQNQPTDQDLEIISSKICKNMFNLKRLVLGFSGNKIITSKGVKTVVTNINNYQRNLEELSLSFVECELITDEAFDWNLSQLSKKLKRLALNFSLCQDITEEGLCALGTSISNHSWPNLRQLTLQFQNCSLISKEGPELFVSMITENLKQLRFLKLNFSWIVKINDKTLDSICQAIKEKLADLQELCLDISCCSRLTQKTRKSLNARLNFIPMLTLTL